MTAKHVSIVPEAPQRSPARQAMIDAASDIAAVAAEIDRHLAEVEAAKQATADVSAAEGALKEAVYEALLSPEGELAKADRLRLVAAVHEARGRCRDVRAAEAAYLAAAPKHVEATERWRAAKKAVVEEEGQRLALVYREHALIAMRAQRAIETLVSWSIHTAGDSMLGVRLRAGLSYHPPSTDADPGALSRSIATLEAAMAAYEAQWRAFPTALETDPDHIVAESGR